jgi:hypothetical protein
MEPHNRSQAHGRSRLLIAPGLSMAHRAPKGGTTCDHRSPNVYSAARRRIASLAGSLALLMQVAIAAWIVINSGTGHPSWR